MFAPDIASKSAACLASSIRSDASSSSTVDSKLVSGFSPVCLCCISSLRPGVLKRSESVELLKMVSNLITFPDIPPVALHAGGVAMGSIVNKLKLEAGEVHKWDETVAPVVREMVLPYLAEGVHHRQAYSAYYILGLLMRGMAMSSTGWGLVQECMALIVHNLDRISEDAVFSDMCIDAQGTGADAMEVDTQSYDTRTIKCAVSLFEMVLSTKDGEQEVCFLDNRTHAVTKVLWQQRFFSSSLRQLIGCLESRKVHWGGKPHLCLAAFAHLLRGAPTGRGLT